MAREIREKFTLAADRINELDSLPPSIDPRSLFPLFHLVSKIPLAPWAPTLVEYLRRQAFAINSRWLASGATSKRADKRTFAADESRQILAPWNTIDRLQPLRLIAFEP